MPYSFDLGCIIIISFREKEQRLKLAGYCPWTILFINSAAAAMCKITYICSKLDGFHIICTVFEFVDNLPLAYIALV